MHLQNFIKIHRLVHKILSINEISASIKGHNSVKNERKLLSNHPSLHLVNINAYTKFERNPQINSQDIEHKRNSDVDQGPLLQHQRQECTIGKNSCFWLLNCTKGNSTKGKENDIIGNNFSHLHHKKQYTFQWQESLKNCRKIRPLSEIFSSNITNSNIVVTNMATFQCNHSVNCIQKKPIN